MNMPEEVAIELGSCISRVIHRDNTLTNIIIRPTCVEACRDYGSDEDFDSDDAEENSITRNILYLNEDFSGSREWFTTLGVMIARLPNLTQLTFDGLDTNARILEGFWGEISASSSLTTLNYINMDCEIYEERVGAPNLRNIVFLRCTISKDILHYLLNDDEPPLSFTTLGFNDCRISNTNAMGAIDEFAFNASLNIMPRHI
jgi:hypothetical protein